MSFRIIIIFVLSTTLIFSCTKKGGDPSPVTPPAMTDTTTLKQMASYPVGVAISYDLMKNNSSYSSLVKKEFDRVTFEYQMKHGANVKNDGTYDFSRADELVGIIQASGLDVYGHTLVWHQNNNGTYLRSLTYTPPAPGYNPALVNTAMQNWITAMVSRNAGKVKAWDVVNEAFEENGSIRTGTSTNDHFYWAPVLGRAYIGNAFRYANAADPNALLFLNDYNLDWSTQKLDSFVAMVDELKGQSVPIHGVATQMHININISNSAIDNMFIKLAATGLKVHVSELDIRINPNNASPFAATEDLLSQQAQKYKYVAESYYNNVPASQRYGITVWNLTDADSWIVTSLGKTDFPTLFNGSFQKKASYTYFKQGLK